MTKDPPSYLYGLAPDPEGVSSARTYAPFHRAAPMQRLEEFSMSLALFYKDRAGPGLPEGVSEAVRVFLFAASGFLAILEDVRPVDHAGQPAADWKALAFGLLWARSQRTAAGAGLTLEEKEDLDRAFINPDARPLLPAWAAGLRDTGRLREGARFAVWAALCRLLEAAPYLEDGETEVALSELLEALTLPDLSA